MKQSRKLQRWMKVLLAKKRLNVDNWYYIKNEPGRLTVLHKHGLKPRVIKYERKSRNGKVESVVKCH